MRKPIATAAVFACLAAPMTAPHAAGAQEDFSVSLAFSSSMQRSDLSELNDALARSDHDPLSEWELLLGSGIVGSVGRLRLGWNLGVGAFRDVRHASGWSGNVYQLQTFLDAGYDVFRFRGLALGTHGGVGLGRFSMDAEPSHPPFAAGAFDPTAEETSLAQTSGLVRAAVGATYHAALLEPKRKSKRLAAEALILLTDLRVGYQQMFAAGDWSDVTGDASLDSSPRVDLSGPFVMLTVGIGGGQLDFGAARDACGPAPPHGTWTALGVTCVPACDSGYRNCDGEAENGCESELASSSRHCGACGNACGPAERCESGKCEKNPLQIAE